MFWPYRPTTRWTGTSNVHARGPTSHRAGCPMSGRRGTQRTGAAPSCGLRSGDLTGATADPRRSARSTARRRYCRRRQGLRHAPLPERRPPPEKTRNGRAPGPGTALTRLSSVGKIGSVSVQSRLSSNTSSAGSTASSGADRHSHTRSNHLPRATLASRVSVTALRRTAVRGVAQSGASPGPAQGGEALLRRPSPTA